MNTTRFQKKSDDLKHILKSHKVEIDHMSIKQLLTLYKIYLHK